MSKTQLKDWYKKIPNCETSLTSIGKELRQRIALGKRILPLSKDIFKAFTLCSFKECKVVILGQDPYHTILEDDTPLANGLCFSSSKEGKIPPSLRNINKELFSDIYEKEFYINQLNIPDNEIWGARIAKQGVLMLNTALTVEPNTPNIHSDIWRDFTENVLNLLAKKEKLIWILWGNNAKSFKHLIPNTHIIYESSHPSPFSASKGFFGSNPFSKCNKALRSLNLEEINW